MHRLEKRLLNMIKNLTLLSERGNRICPINRQRFIPDGSTACSLSEQNQIRQMMSAKKVAPSINAAAIIIAV
jgi:hypothetical protein